MPNIMDAISSVLGSFAGPSGGGFLGAGALPGGALLGGAAGGLLNSLLGNTPSQSTSTFGIPYMDIAPQGGSAIFEPFITGGGSGARSHPFIAINPNSGAQVWFKPAGRPVLWSGDLATCRRVNRIARRVRRRVGGR